MGRFDLGPGDPKSVWGRTRPERFCCAAFLLLALALACGTARAEQREITIAQQFGVSYLPVLAMEDRGLIEKHAAARGIGNLKVNWVQVSGGNVMNDGLLSGTVQIAANAVPSLVLLWDRTRGSVRGLAAISGYPLYLVSRNPQIRSLNDFSPDDKIALPAVKVSAQAIILQMAAAKLFGDDAWNRLDPLTVSMGHPDAVLAIQNNSFGINTHFTASPFYEREMALPGAHVVLSSDDVLGHGATIVVAITTAAFREANPQLAAAFVAALKEATEIVNADERNAAALFLKMTRDNHTKIEDVQAMIKQYTFSVRPSKIIETAAFMGRAKIVRRVPEKESDLFFPEALAND